MRPEIFWINDIRPLRLAIMARPRSGDWLSDGISGWQIAGIDTAVSLLEPHEIRDLSLTDEPPLCAACGIDFLSYPIPDRATPKSVQATALLVDNLVSRLRRGDGVGIHCRAGIGRSGLMGACVLLKLGVSFNDVFSMLSRARNLPVPDTTTQIAWVKNFASLNM